MKGRRKDSTWDGTERREEPVVLVVNDNPDACEMIVRMIGARGYRAIGAVSPDEASGRLVTDLPRCIVLDLEAGGVGTGLKLLDLIRAHSDKRVKTTRVVLCAASPKNRSFSFESGTDSFVVRPFHIDDLVAQIAEVLALTGKDRDRHRRNELGRRGD